MSGSHVEAVGFNVRIMVFADGVTVTLLMDRASAASLREKLGATLDRKPGAGMVEAPQA